MPKVSSSRLNQKYGQSTDFHKLAALIVTKRLPAHLVVNAVSLVRLQLTDYLFIFHQLLSQQAQHRQITPQQPDMEHIKVLP